MLKSFRFVLFLLLCCFGDMLVPAFKGQLMKTCQVMRALIHQKLAHWRERLTNSPSSVSVKMREATPRGLISSPFFLTHTLQGRRGLPLPPN